jgi:hypothetical protein
MKTFSELQESLKNKKDPCWKGYQQVGMKKKNGKEVPNCVPKESSVDEKFKVSYKDTGTYTVAFRNKNGKIEAEVLAKSKESAEKQVAIRNKKVKSTDGKWEVIKTGKGN